MWQLSLAMVAGATAAELTSFVSPTYVLEPLFLESLAARICFGRRAFAGFAIGAAVYLVAALMVIGDRLEPRFAGDSILTRIEVADFPRRRGDSVSFVARPVADDRLPARLRLTWRRPPASPRRGDTWELVLRLKPPRGRVNPGAFDAEEWLFRGGIGATGYVVDNPRNRLIEPAGRTGLSAARNAIAERITRLVPEQEIAAILIAITTGSRHRLTSTQWDRFARTGTSHLIAISGLHVGLAAMFAYLAAAAVLAVCRLPLANHHIAPGIGVLAAFAYTAVSGFGVPAVRALVMLAVGYVALFRRQAIPPADVLSCAALVVVLAEPLAVGSAGFLLSFAAVICLLWLARASRDRGHHSGLARAALQAPFAVRVQAMLFFGLLPLAVILFGRMSPSAPIVNLLVVPIFSLVTVPAALTGMALDGFFSQPGDMALRIAAWSIGAVNRLIGLDLWQGTSRFVVPGAGSLIVAILGTAWAVLPAGWPGRGASLPAVLALLCWQPGGVAAGCFQLTMLDVGQGLAVLVETERSALLYDAGPGWPGGGDLVESVLLPVLRQRGIAALDVTVISHADLDHVGGLTALAAAMPTGRLLAGEPIERVGLTAESCHGRRPWQRDGVRFEFITPASGPRNEGNNLSCVLAVSAREHTALLTGDIERPVEAALAGEGRLRPTVLVTIPHHGSATSSSLEFVRATAPRLAVASAGYANRWGQPRPEVIHRWRSYGANVFSTATGGGLGVTICPDRVGELRRARLERRRIWRLP